MDFDIFHPLILRNWWCIRYGTRDWSSPKKACDWAISLVWWIGIWSTPHVWISKWFHKYAILMALHSICHHGNPYVADSWASRFSLSSINSPALSPSKIHSICLFSLLGLNFHSAKSVTWCLPVSSIRAHDWRPEICWCHTSSPYSISDVSI